MARKRPQKTVGKPASTGGTTRNRSKAGTATAPPPPPPPSGWLDRYFEISARGSTVAREIRGGLATFFTMAYIIVLNPLILGSKADGTGQLLDQAQLAAATALIAGVMSILMGVIARFPLALAAGLGVNAMVATEIAPLPDVTWADAMGLIVIEGVIIAILVLTGLRTAVFNAVPTQLKTAIGVGIGLFLTFIGFVDAGLVRRIPDIAGTTVPVQLGIQSKLLGWPTLVFVLGVIVTLVLVVRRVKGAILIGIIGTTVLAIVVEAVAKVGAQTPDGKNPTGWSLNVPRWPDKVVDLPDFGLLGKFNLLGSWETLGWVTAMLFVFTLMLTDFFDTMGTMVAVGQEGGMLDERGNPPRTREILFVDSLGAAAGGVGSVSSNTAYIESAAGVAEGARTGLASLVTGVLFLAATAVAPMVEIVPFEAATTALVVVGFLMMVSVRTIDWTDYEIAIPAFLTIVLMPFTYSISNGIGAGVIAYVVLKAARGKFREVHPLLWGVAVLFTLYFLRGALETVT